MAIDQLTCQELVELITDYLDDRLTPEARSRFDAHIAGCSGCRSYLNQIRLTIRATGRLRDNHIPIHVRDELLAAFRMWKRE